MLGGCLHSSFVHCIDGTVCPTGTTCDLDRDLCLVPGQLEACAGLAEGAPCTFESTAGVCLDGLCAMSTCGDARVGPGEICDDGNLDSGDGCRSDCRSDETCGNGLIDHGLGEDCDCGATEVAPGCADVNSMTSDVATCRVDCKFRCGDMMIQPGEVCDGSPPIGASCLDHGYDIGLLACSSICTPAFAGCDQYGWIPVDVGVPNPRLNAVWGAASNNVFAVGDFGLVVQWNGSAWSKMTVPAGTSHLEGIWGRSASDVYAVGQGGTILHYDGAAWTAMTTNTTVPLYGITGDSTKVIVVGGDVNSAVILESTVLDPSWMVSTFATPLLHDLHAVVINGGRTIAVGRFGTVCDRPASTWNCSGSGGYGHFTSIVRRPATGRYYIGGTNGLFSALNPTSASVLTPESPGTFGEVFALMILGNDMLIGGGRVYRFDGAGWYQISESAVPNGGLWAAALDDMWAVGLQGARHFAGTTWSFAPISNALDMNRVVAGAIGAYTAGDQGRLLKFVNGGWVGMPGFAIPGPDLVGLSVGTDIVVALEKNGDVRYAVDVDADPYNNFLEDTTEVAKDFVDIWIKDKTQDAFALISENTVYRKRIPTGSWAETSPGLVVSDVMNSIWGTADNDVFVAGSSGKIFHWNGSSWTGMPTAVSFELKRIWGTGPSDVWAVGGSGTILHYNGTSWSKHESGTFATLEGVWGSGPNDVFATGGDTLLHFDGSVWAPMRDSTLDYVTDVGGFGDHVYFVGLAGSSQLLIRYGQ